MIRTAFLAATLAVSTAASTAADPGICPPGMEQVKTFSEVYYEMSIDCAKDPAGMEELAIGCDGPELGSYFDEELPGLLDELEEISPALAAGFRGAYAEAGMCR